MTITLFIIQLILLLLLLFNVICMTVDRIKDIIRERKLKSLEIDILKQLKDEIIKKFEEDK